MNSSNNFNNNLIWSFLIFVIFVYVSSLFNPHNEFDIFCKPISAEKINGYPVVRMECIK